MHQPSLNEVNEYIGAAKNIMDLVKASVSLIPKGQKHPDLEKRLEEAERALRVSEVQLAKALGYHLCQCTFPPEIMLSQGRHERRHREIFKCGNCGKQDPSAAYFAKLDDDDRKYAEAQCQMNNWRI